MLEILRSIVLFLLLLTVIVAVHELGHYLTARLLGMKVLEFGIGFPPKAWGWVHNGILYSLNWLPIGGFVRIFGQDDFKVKQSGEGEPGSFTSKPWWAQAIVLAAGVVMNFLLAIVVLTASFMMSATAPTGDIRIVGTSPDSPAAQSGMRKDDIVKSMDGQRFTEVPALVRYARSQAGREMEVVLTRNGTDLPPITVTPRKTPPEGEGPLGIQIEPVVAPASISLPAAFGKAADATGGTVHAMLNLPGMLLSRGNEGDGGATVGGPIEIFRITGQASDAGPAVYLRLIGLLSVNLGVLNILPFPGLDGGRLFFVLLSGIFRIRLRPQDEALIHTIGIVMLLGLMLMISVADIDRVLRGK